MRRIAFGAAVATLAGFAGGADAQSARPAARIGGVQAVVPAGGLVPAEPSGLSLPVPDLKSAVPVPPATTTIPGPFAGQWGTTAPAGTYAGPLPGPTFVAVPGGAPGVPTVDVPPIAGVPVPGPGMPVDPACLDPVPCGPKWWVSGEGLLWWTKGADLPPLLTTSSPQFNGVPGVGDTAVLFGGGRQDGPYQPGFRVGLGRWLGDGHCWAVDAGFFYLPKRAETFAADSGTFPVLARPFTNLNAGIPFVQILAAPGLSTGAFAARTESLLWGGDVNLRRYLAGNPCHRLDLIGGFRYLSLDERLDMTETFTRVPGSNTAIGAADAASGLVFDSFHTQNRFYGGQIGFDWEIRRGRWFADVTGKFAIGAMRSTVNIDGGQQVNLAGGGTRTAVGGLLALPGNIGTHTESRFAWVPEIGATIGYHLTPRLRATVGYNFLYASHVLRPGDQVDTGLDVTRIPNFPVPGATPLSVVRPAPTFKGTDYWAQGISLGLQYTW